MSSHGGWHAEVEIIGLKRNARQSFRPTQVPAGRLRRRAGRWGRMRADYESDASDGLGAVHQPRHRSQAEEDRGGEVDQPFHGDLRTDRQEGGLRRIERTIMPRPSQGAVHQGGSSDLAARSGRLAARADLPGFFGPRAFRPAMNLSLLGARHFSNGIETSVPRTSPVRENELRHVQWGHSLLAGRIARCHRPTQPPDRDQPVVAWPGGVLLHPAGKRHARQRWSRHRVTRRGSRIRTA